jgi:serine phosphatase RsbU (regulator of sigma subunit)
VSTSARSSRSSFLTEDVEAKYRENADEEFGEKRLIEALRRHRGRSSQTVIASLVDEIHQFSPREQQDDITLIVANVRNDLATI